MARRQEKYLDLSAYKLNYDNKNLFDDEYWVERPEYMIYEEIESLKNKDIRDNLKLGRNILELIQGDATHSNLDKKLRGLKLSIGKTQVLKYIECFNYFNEIFRREQSTDLLDNLGIEKTYLLTTLKDTQLREKLGNFAFSRNLTVKVLAQIIKILNGDSKIINWFQAFMDTLDESEKLPDPNNPF